MDHDERPGSPGRPPITPSIEAGAASLLDALARHDPATFEHALRVEHLATRLADALGVLSDERAAFRLGARLHDIGKLSLPGWLLRSPYRLGDTSLGLVRTHVTSGLTLVERLGAPDVTLQVIGGHHERWDGRGYPAGTGGTAIPLGARIVAVADAYDAMTNHRPYHRIRRPAQAVEVLLEEAGRQFDPDVVTALTNAVRHELRVEGRELVGTAWNSRGTRGGRDVAARPIHWRIHPHAAL